MGGGGRKKVIDYTSHEVVALMSGNMPAKSVQNMSFVIPVPYMQYIWFEQYSCLREIFKSYLSK